MFYKCDLMYFSMSGVNYSKWDHIEVRHDTYIHEYSVSDDEDDTHPNIDTPSLFRWRHQARIERDQEFCQRKQITTPHMG